MRRDSRITPLCIRRSFVNLYLDEGGPFGGPEGGPLGGPDGGPEGGPLGGPDGGPDGGPLGGPDGGPEGGPVGGPEGGPLDGPEDALLGDLDGRLGGVGADEIGAVGTAGGVGALTVSSTAGWFLCNRMSC